jgi:hypothetical protein
MNAAVRVTSQDLECTVKVWPRLQAKVHSQVNIVTIRRCGIQLFRTQSTIDSRNETDKKCFPFHLIYLRPTAAEHSSLSWTPRPRVESHNLMI